MGGGSSLTSASGSSPMKKSGGCEIEARDVSYTICTSTTSSSYPYPFKIWSKEEDEEDRSKEVAENPEEETSKRGSRKVLKNVSCRARPWEIMAIVGPSGAGKSTFLEILAGKLEPDATSAVLVDGKPMERSNFKKVSGYVTQKDTLFPLLTVYETLMFTAKLRLRLPAANLVARVEALLRELGLDHVAGAMVGDERLRGISGGERRRVSIGVDVIHDPKVLILDEPTSGLDSTSALQILGMLKSMAETRGRTVVLSIHQPGFRIVKLFNSVLLLADGSVLYHGTTEQLQRQMRLFDLNLPLHVNIVEFAIDAIDHLQQSHRRRQISEPKDRDHERCTLQQLFQLSIVGEDLQSKNVTRCCRGFANSRFYETLILAHRFSKNILRTKELFALRTLQMLAAGLLLGTIFYNLKDDEVGSQERVGLFAFILTFLLSCTTEALPIFLQEREILMKETSCGSYRVSSYVIANSIVFLPFLLVLALVFSAPLYWLVGLHPCLFPFMYFLLLIWLILYTANSVVVCFSALVPNFIVGNSIISGVMGSFFLFSGYFISKQEVPGYWMFMHYLSLFKYPFEGFLINEFSGKCLVYGNEMCVITGEDVLREEGFGEESRWKNVMIMVGFILLYRFFSYIILRCRCSQSMLKKLMRP